MTDKTRTITMTDQPPVRIHEDEWPEIAVARDSSYTGTPMGAKQARDRGECDQYTLRVRQHSDGRAIVYAVLSAAPAAWGQPAGGVSRRTGELLDDATRIPEAVRRVGEDCGLPEQVIRECVADMPAVEL